MPDRDRGIVGAMTERIYSVDSYAREMAAEVVATDADDGRVLLDRTVFYPGGGGQPVDAGELAIGDDRLQVVGVKQDSDGVWHWLEGGLPKVGTRVTGRIDWDRRYRLMRTHTSLHALCGVIWERFRSPVTGGNMEPGYGRLDFEIPNWDASHRDPVEQALNEAIARHLPVDVSFMPREEADLDPSLIRTKVNLIPPSVRRIRVIDIVGLDRQADGGTHVNTTEEVGRVRITKVQSKGRGFRRIRVALEDEST
ncbi:MAG: alanyl-tRNA editing protein [bacterium]|nr:alanyl-tRNA editing protein [bacterium]